VILGQLADAGRDFPSAVALYPEEAVGGEYPGQIAAATAVLRNHGWTRKLLAG
jgi:hypothetical protein